MESFIFNTIRRESSPSSIESDPSTATIFWLDTARGTLNSLKRDGTERKKIFDDLHSPKRLAFDWISKNLYWTDDEADVIEMADFQGKYRYKVRLEASCFIIISFSTTIFREHYHLHLK